MAQNNIIVNGARIGRIRASILLFKETFRFLNADKEMLAIPIIALFFELFFFGALLLALFLTGMWGTIYENQALTQPSEFILIFLWYIISAFIVAWTQAAITHIVYVRAHGGDATLGSGIAVAFKNWSALLVWSVITSTVGIILRTIAERSQTLVRILTGIMGAAWSVLTYFVVPSIVIGRHSALAGIHDSGSLFKRTWGERLVTNISFSFVFLFAFLAYAIALIGLGFAFGWSLISTIVLIFLAVVGVFVLSLVSSTLGSVLRTLLYIYASEQTVPKNFNRELLEQMLTRKTTVTVSPGSGTSFVG